MGSNIMEFLKQIQRNQHQYIRELHDMNQNISKKFNIIDEKLNNLDIKINQQSVFETVERLEQLVIKNNILLFGVDETAVNMEDKPELSNKEKMKLLVKESEYRATSSFHNTNTAIYEGIKGNSIEVYKNKDILQDADIATNGSEDFTLIQTKDWNAQNISDIDKDITCSVCTHDPKKICSFSLHNERINQIATNLTTLIDFYHSDITEIKECMKKLAETSKMSLAEVKSVFNTLEILHQKIYQAKHVTDEKTSVGNKIQKDSVNTTSHVAAETDMLNEVKNVLLKGNDELFRFKSDMESEMRQMKKVIQDLTVRNTTEAGTLVRQQKTVQISPTYFTADQISKLNGELKRISEMYQTTNVFPTIEVVPGEGDEHPIMKQLCEGVYYEEIGSGDELIHLKLGINNFTRSAVIDYVTEYPNLSFNEVINNWVCASATRRESAKKYDFNEPKIYNKYGNLVNLNLYKLKKYSGYLADEV